VIKKILTALILLGTVTASGAQMYGPAATVNGAEISRTKLQAQVNQLINQRGVGSGGITQPAMYEKMQQEVLDTLIVQELLWQEAQRRDYIAPDEDVDETLRNLKNDFESEQAFLYKIRERGFNEASFREDIRQKRSAKQLVAEDITAAMSISDADVSEFYDANVDRMAVPEQLRARHILVKPVSDDDEGKKTALERIAAIQAELDGGASFALLAVDRSEGPSGKNGGDLGFFERGQMVPPFEEAAFALEPGEVSDVVETQFGFHLIKLEERRGGKTVTAEEASDQIREYLTQQRLQAGVEKLIEDLRASADIESILDE